MNYEMKKITKEQRKRYNQYVDEKNIDNATASGGTPFILLILLVLAYFSNEYVSGKIALGFIGCALVVAIISQSGSKKSNIERHS